MNFTLGTESPDELFVLLVFAIPRKTTKSGRATIKCLGAFMKSFFETVMDKGLFEDL
jgi:hypothetical protein